MGEVRAYKIDSGYDINLLCSLSLAPFTGVHSVTVLMCLSAWGSIMPTSTMKLFVVMMARYAAVLTYSCLLSWSEENGPITC